MTDLFKEILPSILQTKQNVLEDDAKDYNPFIINRALSYHQDCVYFANEMNRRCGVLDKRMQYDFLRSAIRARKRSFQPWVKVPKEQDLEVIKLAYGISTREARNYLSLLSEEQLETIRARMDKGGVVKR